MAERIEAGARVYATALYEAAVDAGKVDEVDRDLAAIAELFDGSVELRADDAQPAAAARGQEAGDRRADARRRPAGAQRA